MKVKAITNNPFAENSYILWDEDSREAAIIDCGALFPEEEARIGAYIEGNNLTIKYLLNTHLHLDHCFGNAWAAEKYGILPMAHQADEPFLAHLGEQATMFGIPPELVKAQKLGGYLNENDTFTLGSTTFRVIHTPGHTPGGVCFYSEQAKMLICGDTLFAGSVGRSDLAGGSHTQLIDSIKNKLLTLPDDTTVYCGHGEYTTIAHEKSQNPFLV